MQVRAGEGKIDAGADHIAGLRVCTGPWGGPAEILGAGDAVEVGSLSLKDGVAVVDNDGLTGSPHQRTGSPGAQNPEVDLEADLYYHDPALWAALALTLGADTRSDLGGGVHQHDLAWAAGSDRGRFLTVVDPGALDLKEAPQWKPKSVTFTFGESKQRSTVKLAGPASDFNRNIGGSPAPILGSTVPLNGPLAAAAVPFASRLTVILDNPGDALTELVLSFTGQDEHGDPVTATYTLSEHGKRFTTPVAFEGPLVLLASGVAGVAAGARVRVEAAVIASTQVANGPLVIDAQAPSESPLRFTLDDADGGAGPTSLTLSVAYRDRRHRLRNDVFTLADAVLLGGKKTFTTTRYVGVGRDGLGGLVSATLSDVTGATAGDTIRAERTNGRNNLSTAAALTTAAERDVIAFSDLRVWVRRQDLPGDFTEADEQFISSAEITSDRNLDTVISSRRGYLPDEPKAGGGGWASVTFKLGFSRKSARNRRLLEALPARTPLRVKLVASGPEIPGTTTPHSLTFYLNGWQPSGEDNTGGAGSIKFDLSGNCKAVAEAPEGFPAGHRLALAARLINGQAGPLA